MENVRQRQPVGRNHASELGEAASDPHHAQQGTRACRIEGDHGQSRSNWTSRGSVAMQSDGEGRARLLHQPLLN